MILSSLPEEYREFVNAEVASGHYSAPEDVVIEALRLFRDLCQQHEELAAEVGQRIAQADRGEVKEQNVDALMQRVEERFQRERREL